MIGDKLSDLEAAKNAKLKAFYLIKVILKTLLKKF